MTRLLYEVAAVTETTRNRDVLWTIKPICTSRSCRIHPPLHKNLHRTHDSVAAAAVPFSHQRAPDIRPALGSHQLSAQASECFTGNFEVGQTISGYSSGGVDLTGEMSISCELAETSWLREPPALDDEAVSVRKGEERVEWKETRSALTPFNDPKIKAVLVPSPSVVRDVFPTRQSGKAGYEGDERQPGCSVLSSPKDVLSSQTRSFRDVLLGLGTSTEVSDGSDNLGPEWSGVSQAQDKINDESFINSSNSLSVPEPEHSRRDRRSQLVNKMVRIDGKGDQDSASRNSNAGNVQEANSNASESNSQRSDAATSDVGESTSNASTTSEFSVADSSSPNPKGKWKVAKRRKKIAACFTSPSSPAGQGSKALTPHRSPNVRDHPTSPMRNGCIQPHPRSTQITPKGKENLDAPSIANHGTRSSGENIGKGNAFSNSREQNSHETCPESSVSSKCEADGSVLPSDSGLGTTNGTDASVLPSDSCLGTTNGADGSVLPSDSCLGTTNGADGSVLPSDSCLGAINGTDLGVGSTTTDKMSSKSKTPHRENAELEVAQVEIEATSGVSSELVDSQLQNGLDPDSAPSVNKRVVLQNSPYRCAIPHSEEFKTLEEFWSEFNHHPNLLKTERSRHQLMSICQRVVRVSVRKPYSPSDPDMAKEYRKMQHDPASKRDKKNLTEQFGTGFAYHVDQFELRFRTHAQVVGSIEDARNTIIQFNLHDQRCREQLTIEFIPNVFGFRRNQHSRSSIFSCTVPPNLIPFLHVFDEIPELDKKLPLFDVFYPSEQELLNWDEISPIVPECPIEKWYIETSSKAEQAWDIVVRNEQYQSEMAREKQDAQGEQAATQPSESRDDAMDIQNSPPNELPTQTFSPVSQPWDYFMRDPSAHCGNSPRHRPNQQDQFQTSEQMSFGEPDERTNTKDGDVGTSNGSPLQDGSPSEGVMTHGLAEASGDWRLSGTSGAMEPPVFSGPYVDIPGVSNVFTPFSSHAADLIESALGTAGTSLNVSPFLEPNEPWDMASLLYAQNCYRDEYAAAFTADVHRYDNASKQCDAPTRRRLFTTPGPSWRLEDLCDPYWNPPLSLEMAQNLSDLQLEDMVARMLYDPHEQAVYGNMDRDHRLRQAFSASRHTSIAIVISYPHGGPKAVSCGYFSTKHIGGELHTAPTCMGSCGAPIVSFGEEGAIYLTDVIHGGTVCARDKIEKFGLYHFYDDFEASPFTA